MVHENLGELTPAIFRDLKKTPLSALAARSNRSFPRRGIFSGHTFIKMPRLHLSCESHTANWVRGRKSVVLLARELF